MRIKKSELYSYLLRVKPYYYSSSIAVIKHNEYIVYSYDTLILVYNIEK